MGGARLTLTSADQRAASDGEAWPGLGFLLLTAPRERGLALELNDLCPKEVGFLDVGRNPGQNPQDTRNGKSAVAQPAGEALSRPSGRSRRASVFTDTRAPRLRPQPPAPDAVRRQTRAGHWVPARCGLCPAALG